MKSTIFVHSSSRIPVQTAANERLCTFAIQTQNDRTDKEYIQLCVNNIVSMSGCCCTCKDVLK